MCEFEETIIKADKEAMKACEKYFKKVEDTGRKNQWKVLAAFRECGVGSHHFAASTGYGYDDAGKDTLDKVLALCFNKEDAIIRHSFASGTATITVGLFGILRPHDRLLIVTGEPYDTLQGVLGHNNPTDGSLTDFNVGIDIVPLKNQKVDIDRMVKLLCERKYKAVYVQRSRGYSLRPTLSVEEINNIFKSAKKADKNIITMLDNCYGEFVEESEPDADIMMGSLIKNPGGAIAPCGGYIAGKSELIKKCAARMTAPGVGREIGATLGHNRELFMGLFSAPHVVTEALKTAIYAAALFEILGFTASPRYSDKRFDIIETLILNNENNLIAFCKGLQSASPIDSFAVPTPTEMPGYDDKIIMAAGAFTLGSSIELSADAPLKEPYAVFLQGSINFDSGRYGILTAAQKVLEESRKK